MHPKPPHVSSSEAMKQLKANVKSLSQENSALKGEAHGLSGQMQQLDGEIQRLNEENSALIGDARRASEQMQKLNTEVQRLGDENSALKDEARGLSERMQQLDGEIQRLNEENSALVGDARRASEQTQKLNTEVQRLGKENGALKATARRLSGQRIQLKDDISRLINRLKLYRNVGAVLAIPYVLVTAPVSVPVIGYYAWKRARRKHPKQAAAAQSGATTKAPLETRPPTDAPKPPARPELPQPKAKSQVTTPPKDVLFAAHAVAKGGDHDRAIAEAEANLPADLAYAASILRANAALARDDIAGWQSHLNDYLGHFGAAPIALQGEGTTFDRLSCAPLPEVTGGPLISVIMPAWNAEETVRKAAGSILAQTWRNLELLIVDDASTDGTWAALQEIANSDSRVRILRAKVNVGPYVLKNIALTQSKGEWITGHDADDWAHPQRLEQHINTVLQNPNPPRASHTYMIRCKNTGAFDNFSKISSFSFDGVSRVSSISTLFSSKFIKEELGFWDSVRFGADSEMLARARKILGDEFQELRTISDVMSR